MTTVDMALVGLGKSLQNMAAKRAARKQVPRGLFVQLWNLLLVVSGLACFTYAAWTVTHSLGVAVAGVSLFALRSIVDWRSDES